MTRRTLLSILFMAGLAFGGQVFGQVDQKKLPDDVRLLIGKHVVVVRYFQMAAKKGHDGAQGLPTAQGGGSPHATL